MVEDKLVKNERWLAGLPSTLRGVFPWIIFLLGLGLFGYCQFTLIYETYQGRAAPLEVDDAYGYIDKTPQLAECFNQDCPALNDLRAQFTPSPGDPEPLAHQKWRFDVRTFTHYHPFYSLGLLALTKVAGVSLEEGYRQISLFGSLGLALALAWFFLKLTDPATAGITLATLALTIFPHHGIHYVVPSNLAMVVGFIMFAYLAQRNGRPNAVFYFLNLLALGLHPIGLAYVGMAAAFGVTLRYPQLKTRAILAYIPSFALMGFYWGLIHLLARPTMMLLPQIIPFDTTYGKEVIANFNYLYSFLRGWRFDYGWPVKFSLYWFEVSRLVWGGILLAGLALGFMGLRSKDGWYRWPLLVAAAIILLPMGFTLGTAALFGLLLIRGLCENQSESPRKLQLAIGITSACLLFACFSVWYRYPASMVARIYVVWAVTAALIWGRGLVLMIKNPGLGSFLVNRLPVPITSRIPSISVFWRLLLMAFLLVTFTFQLPKVYKFRLQTITGLSNRQDISLDPSQPQLMLKLTSPEDIILYGDDPMQITLPFFLSHGALHRRAVYVPFLPQSSGPVYDPARVKLLAAMNPYLTLSTLSPVSKDLKLAKSLKKFLRLSPGETLKLYLEPGFRSDSLKIHLIPGNPAATGHRLILTREAAGKSDTQELELSGEGGSFSLPAAYAGGSISLYNPDKDQSVAVGGLNLGPAADSGLQWPWEGVTNVVLEPSSGHQPPAFSIPREYAFQGRKYRMEILKDKGFSVMWKLTLLPQNN